MTCTEIIRNKNKLYTQMTNKELFDALDSMMNLSSKAEICICDEAGNDLWKGI